MKRILLATALGLSFFATASAFASEGYVTGDVDLLAGPDEGYPVVGMLRAGTGVGIYGCVDGWYWCDVDSRYGRGWVRGDFLQEDYQGRRVRLSDYGLQIGIPFITFEFGSYWDSHYRNRSWYHDRQRYSSVQPHYSSISVNINSRSSSDQSRSRDTSRTQVVNQPRTRVVNQPIVNQSRSSNDRGAQARVRNDRNAQGNQPMARTAPAPRAGEQKTQPKARQGRGNGKDNKDNKDKNQQY